MHGIWGMSYKYHERAIVTNEKNLIRLFDIAYDGYNGGKDDTFVSWTDDAGHRSWKTLQSESANTTMPYTGPSIMVSDITEHVFGETLLKISLHRSWHFQSTTRTSYGRGAGLPPSSSTSRTPASLSCRCVSPRRRMN